VDPTANRFFYSVAVDPTDANRAYVGGSYMYRSVDGGDSWSQGTQYLYARSIAIDPLNPANLCVGGSGAAHVSSNYGQTWTARSGAISGIGQHVECAPAAPSNIFICSADGLYKSSNSGGSFSLAHEGIQNIVVPALAAAPSSPSTLYVENDGNGMLASFDSGERWQDLGYFVACGNVGALAVHPGNPDIVLALEGGG
jgi:photosystem II stability/assembly factor-like uncharacterized protein